VWEAYVVTVGWESGVDDVINGKCDGDRVEKRRKMISPASTQHEANHSLSGTGTPTSPERLCEHGITVRKLCAIFECGKVFCY
jgi:hypothetical protein